MRIARGAQSGSGPALPPGRATDQPPAEQFTKLKTGPPLPPDLGAPAIIPYATS